jgi:hypothetical protein
MLHLLCRGVNIGIVGLGFGRRELVRGNVTHEGRGDLTDRDQIRVMTLNHVLEGRLPVPRRLRLEPDFHRTGLAVGPGEVRD